MKNIKPQYDMGYKNLGKGKLLSMSINDFISHR